MGRKSKNIKINVEKLERIIKRSGGFLGLFPSETEIIELYFNLKSPVPVPTVYEVTKSHTMVSIRVSDGSSPKIKPQVGFDIWRYVSSSVFCGDLNYTETPSRPTFEIGCGRYKMELLRNDDAEESLKSVGDVIKKWYDKDLEVSPKPPEGVKLQGDLKVNINYKSKDLEQSVKEI